MRDGLGDLGGRDAGSTFGIKSFTCQVKHDRDFLPDPVRGSSSTCQGAPKTSTLSIPASSISNTYTNEKQWRDINSSSTTLSVGSPAALLGVPR